MEKLQTSDLIHATAGIAGLFGVVFLVQVLPEIFGHALGTLLGCIVIVWDGLCSLIVAYLALKGGYGKIENHRPPE